MKVSLQQRSIEFIEYRRGQTLVPVHRITPDDAPYIHSYYDICPWSSEQNRFLCLRLPFENKEPSPDDFAVVCVIDLENRTIADLYRTSGWAYQTGAYQQWGPSNDLVYFNEINKGKYNIVEYDLNGNTRRRIPGSLYQLSPDGRCALSASTQQMSFIQKGYGLPVSPHALSFPNSGCPDSEGLWRVDIESGKRELLVGFQDMIEAIPELRLSEKHWFFFQHTKFNAAGDRILQVGLRLTLGDKPRWRRFIITFDSQGRDIRLALPPEKWLPGSHHPTWDPNGRDILMNLKDDRGILRFCRIHYDGSRITIIRPDLTGGGHPTLHPRGRWMITDAYVEEPISLKNGDVPIRLIDADGEMERTLFYLPVMATESLSPISSAHTLEDVPAAPGYTLGEITNKQSDLDLYRLDPHPSWSRDHRCFSLNATPRGRRQVLIADMDTYL